MTFPTSYPEITQKLDTINPVSYGKTRNFIDGDITRLSPYISRGVISTKMVMNHVIHAGYSPYEMERFLQELAWRDYWQQIWIEKGDAINSDLKQQQPNVANHEMPVAIIEAKTGIEAIDKAITDYYLSGYLHNHVRMYIAAIVCNIGQSHWRLPAQWMYYHLIDGDWASNALSWQWVAGANANKKYFANQENINKYCYTEQAATFLDVPYEAFENMPIPSELLANKTPILKTPLPKPTDIYVDASKPTLLYNYYNLDPLWHQNKDVNRILLLEPSIFQRYPISKNAVNFMIALAKNIPNIQVFVGEYEALQTIYHLDDFHFKEHPLNHHYQGKAEPRDWMFSVKGYYPSFFAFWKKCRKELQSI